MRKVVEPIVKASKNQSFELWVMGGGGHDFVFPGSCLQRRHHPLDVFSSLFLFCQLLAGDDWLQRVDKLRLHCHRHEDGGGCRGGSHIFGGCSFYDPMTWLCLKT